MHFRDLLHTSLLLIQLDADSNVRVRNTRRTSERDWRPSFKVARFVCTI